MTTISAGKSGNDIDDFSLEQLLEAHKEAIAHLNRDRWHDLDRANDHIQFLLEHADISVLESHKAQCLELFEEMLDRFKLRLIAATCSNNREIHQRFWLGILNESSCA